MKNFTTLITQRTDFLWATETAMACAGQSITEKERQDWIKEAAYYYKRLNNVEDRMRKISIN